MGDVCSPFGGFLLSGFLSADGSSVINVGLSYDILDTGGACVYHLVVLFIDDYYYGMWESEVWNKTKGRKSYNQDSGL